MKIGIIGAMKAETEYLIRRMENRTDCEYAGRVFHTGNLAGIDCVVVMCGVGKVNAAVCTQILVDRFQVTHLINTGVAGSLNNEINIGDIVISEKAVYHDMDAVNFGYAYGEIPSMGVKEFKADPALALAAEEAVRKAAPQISVFRGTVATGDQFIREKEKKTWIRETFGADCTEMEGTAIAHTAWLNDIPFVIVRAISDKADESVSVSYDEFESRAAEHCARMIMNMLERMKNNEIQL